MPMVPKILCRCLLSSSEAGSPGPQDPWHSRSRLPWHQRDLSILGEPDIRSPEAPFRRDTCRRHIFEGVQNRDTFSFLRSLGRHAESVPMSTHLSSYFSSINESVSRFPSKTKLSSTGNGKPGTGNLYPSFPCHGVAGVPTRSIHTFRIMLYSSRAMMEFSLLCPDSLHPPHGHSKTIERCWFSHTVPT